MNNHFSISRYKTLLAIEWQTYHKRYLFIMLAMIAYWALYGLAGLWFLTFADKDIFTNPTFIQLAFDLQVVGFIGFVASDMFTDLGRNINRSAYYLILPCTILEKFTTKLLISGVLFWIVFFTSVFIGLAVLWNIFYPMALSSDSTGLLINKQFDICYNIQVFSTGSLFIHAFLIHSFFITGAVVLKRFKFIKTLFMVIIFYAFAALLDQSTRPNVYYLYIYMVLTAIIWFIAYHRFKKYTL